jgi:alpha-galactosidase
VGGFTTSMRRRRPTRLLPAIALTLIAIARPTEAVTLAVSGDASISHETDGTWILAAGGATLTLAADASRDFAVVKFTSASGKTVSQTGASDSLIRVNGATVPFGHRMGGFAFDNVSVAAQGNRLQLNATFTLASARLRVTRHYIVVSDSPTFEVWNTYAPTAGDVTLSDLNALQLTVPHGALVYLSGLEGDTADVAGDNPFTLKQQTLATGEHFTIGAQGRASEKTVPWFAVDGARAQDEFYAALMWSGAWSLDVDRSGSGLAFSFGLATMTTTISAPIDGPHAVFGAAAGGLTQASEALRSYVLNGIRGGRPLASLVTYNTWFAYGTQMDESSLLAEMERAAALGVELFVVDAGWYEGAGAAGIMDFDSGVGSWTVDPVRFPNGLKPLRDFAHSLRMQFGIWVEPERVNLSLVNAAGVDEHWLATQGGEYGSERAGQICLANAAARQWLLDQLTTLIDQVQPDYLKWDNNLWINCDRDGHGHGSTDGNFGHVHGLYDMLSGLRDRYPNLQIENVSGGGNRLDIGMLRYSDVAWMDDRTTPSVHVRHNIEGLSVVFPPAYLLSFVTDHEGEPLHDARDLSLYFRSRMVGALGLCFKTSDFTEGESASIAHEIAIYKTMRETLSVASGALLTTQAESDSSPAWDVLQEGASGNQQLLISAFQTDQGVRKLNVKPTGLDGPTTYVVQSVDTGILGTTTGWDLMANGVDLLQSPNTAAHILIIKVKP